MLEIAGLLQCCGGVSETMFLVKCPCPVFLPVLNTDIRQAPGIHCPSIRACRYSTNTIVPRGSWQGTGVLEAVVNLGQLRCRRVAYADVRLLYKGTIQITAKKHSFRTDLSCEVDAVCVTGAQSPFCRFVKPLYIGVVMHYIMTHCPWNVRFRHELHG